MNRDRNRDRNYYISLAQLEHMAQLISALDYGKVRDDQRIQAASEAHGIVADVLGPDERLVYPTEDSACATPQVSTEEQAA